MSMDHRQVAEEIAAARHSIDSTLLLLRGKLNELKTNLENTVNDLESTGAMSSAAGLGSVQEAGFQIDRLVQRLEIQRQHLEQALAHIRIVQTTR